MPRATSRHDRPGLTLLDLVVALLIMAVLASIAMPRYASSIASYRADAAAKRIAADLALAQRQAKISSSPQPVDFFPSTNKYSLSGVKDLDRPQSTYSVDLAAPPYRATLVSANFGGDGRVVFDIYGTPDTGGQVVVAVGTWQKTIVVNRETGRAAIQ